VNQKYLAGFEMLFWRRMERIGWAGRVRNEGILKRFKE
jgi:hypothetical protein